jgi:hypothetical protein
MPSIDNGSRMYYLVISPLRAIKYSQDFFSHSQMVHILPIGDSTAEYPVCPSTSKTHAEVIEIQRCTRSFYMFHLHQVPCRYIYISKILTCAEGRNISDLPHTNRTIDVRLETSLWCPPKKKDEESCDAPEVIRQDLFSQNAFAGKTISFKAYILLHEMMDAVIGTPDISCSSSTMKCQQKMDERKEPPRLSDLSVWIAEVKR